MKFSTIHMRLPANDKLYYLKQLQIFADHFNDNLFVAVEYGKQDTRGMSRITLVYKDGSTTTIAHFKTSGELLAFVQGYNHAVGLVGGQNQNTA